MMKTVMIRKINIPSEMGSMTDPSVARMAANISGLAFLLSPDLKDEVLQTPWGQSQLFQVLANGPNSLGFGCTVFALRQIVERSRFGFLQLTDDFAIFTSLRL